MLARVVRVPLLRGGAATRRRPLGAAAAHAKTDEPHLRLSFTCTHANCHSAPSDRRGRVPTPWRTPLTKTPARDKVTKHISKVAYNEGVVLVRCACDKLHLVADRLGWFDDDSTDIEKIVRDRGDEVKRLATVQIEPPIGPA